VLLISRFYLVPLSLCGKETIGDHISNVGKVTNDCSIIRHFFFVCIRSYILFAGFSILYALKNLSLSNPKKLTHEKGASLLIIVVYKLLLFCTKKTTCRICYGRPRIQW
jgi:hypothetical protein